MPWRNIFQSSPNSIKFLTITLALFLVNNWFISAVAAEDSLNLSMSSNAVAAAVTTGGGSRGPALEVMRDGTLLLGGGLAGGEVFTWSSETQKLTRVGSVIPVSRRLIDSRFAITDIAVLSENSTQAQLVISYPRLGANKRCVEVVVDQYLFNKTLQTLKRNATWFISKPCVPISAVQHASGRFEVIDKGSVYVTVGDLGFSAINSRSKRGDLGSIFKLTAKKTERVSQGHRNAQGILLFNGKDLLAAEHGPRGGDELNLIKQGGDYGWPFVTYGEPYGSGDYVKPTKTGTHQDYIPPLKYWVPSIAPTELVQLPTSGWGFWNGAVVLGTLKDNSLVFMKLDNQLQVTDTKVIKVNQRIRDLEVNSSGSLIATTDEGNLIRFAIRD
jgi:glucose/arabinose dehydrogenase